MVDDKNDIPQQAAVEDVLELRAIFEGSSKKIADEEKPNPPKRRPAPSFKISRLGLCAFLIAAILTFGGLWSVLVRHYTIGLVKHEIIKIQDSLNEGGWDIAYENVKFSSGFPGSLMQVENLQLYSFYQGRDFKLEIPKLELKANLFNPRKLSLRPSSEMSFSYKGKTYQLDIPHPLVILDLADDNRLSYAIVSGKEINVQNTLQISDFMFAAVRKTPANEKGKIPAWECDLQVANIQFDKGFNLPMSDKIDMIYANADIIGKVKNSHSYRSGIYEWLKIGGFIDLKHISLNWKPLALVGRGELYFNEKLEPNLHLETSSKGMLESLDSMLQYEWLESKGVFVSKILLSNKAFRLSTKDKYLTVISPLDIKDNKLMIENITVAKF